jgi:hypothetical protein
MSMSARLFLERYGLRPTFRNPVPTVAAESYPIHDEDLSRADVPDDAPMPVPDALFVEPPLSDGNATTEPWPYEEDCT